MVLNNDVDAPDKRCFQRHIQNGRFRLGVEDNKWRLISSNLSGWPKVVIMVRATFLDNAPAEYAFRFDLDQYPNQAPTAQPWDSDSNSPLPPDKWPRGKPNSRVAQVFRPEWNQTALYLPCDRLAIQGHPDWLNVHRRYLWSGDKDISFFLNILHELLTSSNYQGNCCA